MKRLLYEYIEHNKRRGFREKTLIDHNKRLNIFFEFLEENYPDVLEITDITNDIVLAYEKYLTVKKDSRGKVMSRERRYRYLSVLKVFFTGLQKEEKIFKNPTANVALPKLKKQVIKDVLTVDEMDSLFKACTGGSMKDLRDRAILELLYSTGIRSDELCNIEIQDIDLFEKILFVRKGKLDKERIIPFGRTCSLWVHKYIEKARPFISNGSNEYLFTSMVGTKLRPPVLCKIIRQRGKKAGIEKNITTHTFRHSCATHMLKGRADIRYVQQQLGHRSIQTTEKYLKIEITDLKEAHERCHPREQEEWGE